MEVEKKSDVPTMLSNIEKCIEPRATVIGDCCEASDRLDHEWFLLQKMNHSVNVQDPDKRAHINSI